MAKDDFAASLRAADRATAAHGLPEAVERRIRERLARHRDATERRRSPAWRWAIALSLVGAACAVALALGRRTPPPRPAPDVARSEPSIGGFVVGGASGDLDAHVLADRSVRIERGHCTLVDRPWGGRLVTSGGAHVRREDAGVRVLGGTVDVQVDKRAPGQVAVVVLVSHGAIRVLGTRFTVEQEPAGGRVTLYEGAIVFASEGHRDRVLSPGQSLRWPLDAEPPPRHVQPPRPAPEKHDVEILPVPSAEEKHLDIDEVLEHVAVLRSRGRYEECVSELVRAMRDAQSPASHERLSFEVGSILTYQLHDRGRACAHWTEHRRNFPGTRYQAEIDRAHEQSGCAAAEGRE